MRRSTFPTVVTTYLLLAAAPARADDAKANDRAERLATHPKGLRVFYAAQTHVPPAPFAAPAARDYPRSTWRGRGPKETFDHIARSSFLRLREAIEASWGPDTSYLAVREEGNPALGQCYPTSRVIQFHLPDAEIMKGLVWTGESEEIHFWNALRAGEHWFHIDLTWHQFPHGSSIRSFAVLDRANLGDGPETISRCERLRQRVSEFLFQLEASTAADDGSP